MMERAALQREESRGIPFPTPKSVKVYSRSSEMASRLALLGRTAVEAAKSHLPIKGGAGAPIKTSPRPDKPVSQIESHGFPWYQINNRNLLLTAPTLVRALVG